MPIKKPRRTPNTYFDLVRQFPLKAIEDDDELDAAERMIHHLLEQNLDAGGEQYLDALTELVWAYEQQHHALPDASEADVLRELMAANRLSQQKLAKEVGISQSTISAVLNGNRSLTKGQILILARRFNLSPAVFLPKEARETAKAM